MADTPSLKDILKNAFACGIDEFEKTFSEVIEHGPAAASMKRDYAEFEALKLRYDSLRSKVEAYKKAHDVRIEHSKRDNTVRLARETWFAERDVLNNDVHDALVALRAEVSSG